MHSSRQRRLRVLEALERRAKQFRTDEDLYPLRVPREPVPLTDVVEEALADGHVAFDPLTLRSRTLLHFAWEDGSTWEAWVLMLPSGLKLFCDLGAGGAHVLGSGGRHAGDETDRQFLQLLCESAGERFGIEMAGGAPARVRCSVGDRAFLVDLLTHLFELTGAEESLRSRLARQGKLAPDEQGGRDFRAEVERWLEIT